MKKYAVYILALLSLSVAAQRPGDDKPDKQIPGFKVEFKPGLGHYSRTDLPVPIAVRVENTSGKDFDGYMKLDYHNTYGKRIIQLPVKLPNNSHKIYHTCIDMGSGSNVLCSFIDSGKVFWEKVRLVNLRDNNSEATFCILMVDAGERPLRVSRTLTGGSQANSGWDSMPNRMNTVPLCGVANAWQLPENDPPLYAYDAVLFSNKGETGSLTARQVAALGKYLVGGGNIVLPDSQTDFRKRLFSQLPLTAEWTPTLVRANVRKQAVGKGMLITYQGSLFPFDHDNAGATEQQVVINTISRSPTPTFPGAITHAPRNQSYQNDTTVSARGTVSILIVIGMFLLYTIVIGPFTFCFRKNKRNMAIFLGISIASFIGLSIVCGIFLRNRRGDMEWTTVTELTPQGGIQVGGITLKSCAGQNHSLKMEPKHTELWLTAQDLSYKSQYFAYAYQTQQMHFRKGNATFPIQNTSNENTSLMEAPLAPWGTGYAIGRTYVPELKPLQLNVKVLLDQAVQDQLESTKSQGKRRPTARSITDLGAAINGSITNTFDIPLKDVEVILQVYTAHNNQYYGSNNSLINAVALIPKALGKLDPGETRHFNRRLAHGAQYGHYYYGYEDTNIRYNAKYDKGRAGVYLPKLNQHDRMQVILLARIDRTPGMKPDGGDFVIGKGSHYIMQTLPVDEMPDITDIRIDAGSITTPTKK